MAKRKKVDLYCQWRNCSRLNVFFSGVSITYQYHTAFLRYGASNNGALGKTSYIRAKCVNISKTVGDTSKVTIDD